MGNNESYKTWFKKKNAQMQYIAITKMKRIKNLNQVIIDEI